MFAPARFPALALPEDVGGMLLDDGGVEVACTPLHAVASVARHDVVGAPPRELCVFGVVDAVKIFDGGGDDESRARLVVDLRSGPAPTDRCEAWFFGGAALGCAAWRRPASRSSRRRRGWAGPTAARSGAGRGPSSRRSTTRRSRRPRPQAWAASSPTGRRAVRPRGGVGSGPCARSASGRRVGGRGDVGARVRASAAGSAAADAGRRRRALRVVPALRRAAPARRAEPARGRARLRRRARAGARAVPVAVFAAAARRAARCY